MCPLTQFPTYKPSVVTPDGGGKRPWRCLARSRGSAHRGSCYYSGKNWLVQTRIVSIGHEPATFYHVPGTLQRTRPHVPRGLNVSISWPGVVRQLFEVVLVLHCYYFKIRDTFRCILIFKKQVTSVNSRQTFLLSARKQMLALRSSPGNSRSDDLTERALWLTLALALNPQMGKKGHANEEEDETTRAWGSRHLPLPPRLPGPARPPPPASTVPAAPVPPRTGSSLSAEQSNPRGSTRSPCVSDQGTETGRGAIRLLAQRPHAETRGKETRSPPRGAGRF